MVTAFISSDFLILIAYTFPLFQMLWKAHHVSHRQPTTQRSAPMTTALTPFQATWAPRALGVLRIVAGDLFIAHGTAKLLGFPHVAMFDNLQAWTLPWIAGVLELVGGGMLIAGLFTRPVAFVLSGLMAFAYFIGHASQGTPLLPLLNK